MTEQDILNLIAEDEWMMEVLRTAEKLNLLDWMIGAGFVRNKVWDYLHGFEKDTNRSADIDLVYYNQNKMDEKDDKKLSKKLTEETGREWEVVNEAYAHKWNNLPPYKSTEDAISQWPETATGIGVILKDRKLKLIAPHGIRDLVNLIVRPSPAFANNTERIKQRSEQKHWLEKWPRLKLVI